MDYNDCFGRLYLAATQGVASVDTSDLGGCGDRTPLHIAMTPDQVQALVEAGADVNARDNYGNTPLHKHGAAISPTEDSLEIVDLLLEAGADPTIKDDDGGSVVRKCW